MRKTIAAFAAFMATCAAALAAGSADDVLNANHAAMGGSAWDSKITLSSVADYSGQGLTGVIHTLQDLKNGRSVSDYSLGPAKGANGFDGTTPWQKDTSGTITQQQGGDALVLAVNDAYRTANKWWLPDHGGAEIVSHGETDTPAGRFDVLTITPKGGKAFDAWFDAKTHFLVKTVEKQGAQTVTTLMSDYGPESGVMVPHKMVIDTGVGEKYLQTIKVT